MQFLRYQQEQNVIIYDKKEDLSNRTTCEETCLKLDIIKLLCSFTETERLGFE